MRPGQIRHGKRSDWVAVAVMLVCLASLAAGYWLLFKVAHRY